MADATHEAMAGQFDRAFTMLERAVALFPDESWRECDDLRPAGIVIHTLETIEFYTSGKSADEFPWGQRFGLDWEGAPAEELPAKESAAVYLREVRDAFGTWLETADLTAPETAYPWTGPTVLDRLLYLLRNTQHHIGQLALALRLARVTPPDWQ